MKRRSFLQGSLATTAVVIAAGAGIIKPSKVLAAAWPEAALAADTSDAALDAAFGTTDVADSADIVIKAPLQAENGAVVPIKITANIPVESIAVVVEKNPSPMVALVNVGEGGGGVFSIRVRMGETSPVHCIVKSGGKVFKATQEIKVTVGGCGG
ncbi:MAG: sulfur-oxidizing protein SoxY [Gammaproteobacteria bacterium]|jgi:sulfur-oxidizing protein SoxY